MEADKKGTTRRIEVFTRRKRYLPPLATLYLTPVPPNGGNLIIRILVSRIKATRGFHVIARNEAIQKTSILKAVSLPVE